MSDKCKYERISRPGLYLLVFFIFFDSHGCIIKEKTNQIKTQLDTIENKINDIQARQARNDRVRMYGSDSILITHNTNSVPLEK